MCILLNQHTICFHWMKVLQALLLVSANLDWILWRVFCFGQFSYACYLKSKKKTIKFKMSPIPRQTIIDKVFSAVNCILNCEINAVECTTHSQHQKPMFANHHFICSNKSDEQFQWIFISKQQKCKTDILLLSSAFRKFVALPRLAGTLINKSISILYACQCKTFFLTLFFFANSSAMRTKLIM